MGSQTVSVLRADWPTCSGCISKHMSGPAWVPESAIFIELYSLFLCTSQFMTENSLSNKFPPENFSPQTTVQAEEATWAGFSFNSFVLYWAQLIVQFAWPIHSNLSVVFCMLRVKFITHKQRQTYATTHWCEHLYFRFYNILHIPQGKKTHYNTVKEFPHRKDINKHCMFIQKTFMIAWLHPLCPWQHHVFVNTFN